LKKILVFLFLGIFLLTLISATIEEVPFKIKADYENVCEENCTDITVNGTLFEDANCITDCYAIIRITKGNNLTNFITWEIDTRLPIEDTYRYGSAVADVGNDSVITEAFVQLGKCVDETRKLAHCMANLSDRDLKLNNCINGIGSNESRLNSELEQARGKVSEKDKEIKDLESGKTMWFFYGLIGAFVVLKFLLPKIKGETPPRDKSEFPKNPGYNAPID